MRLENDPVIVFWVEAKGVVVMMLPTGTLEQASTAILMRTELELSAHDK
jgi:hypothetical protein